VQISRLPAGLSNRPPPTKQIAWANLHYHIILPHPAHSVNTKSEQFTDNFTSGPAPFLLPSYFMPLSKFANGRGRSTPSINLGLAAQGVTLETPVKSIQYCNLAVIQSRSIERPF
jgi:hypothetical protein